MNLLKNWSYLGFIGLALLYFSGCGQTSDSPNVLSNTSGIPAVSNLDAEASLTEIDLSWINPEFEDSYYIRVQYKKSTEEEYKIAATLKDSVDSFKLVDLASLQTYDIRIQTITKDGRSSAYSDKISAKTIFAQTNPELKYPTFQNPTTVFASYNSTRTTWTWSEINFSNFQSVNVFRQIYNDGTWTLIAGTNITSSTVTFSDNPQASTVAYRFTINYKDGASANIEPLSASYSLPEVTQVEPLVVSTNVKLDLTWSNTTHADGVQSFEVQRKKTSDSSYSSLATVNTNGGALPSSYTDNSLDYADGSVTYRIKVIYYYDSVGYDYSPESADIAIPASTVPLTSPTSLSVTVSNDNGNRQGNVSWYYPTGQSYADSFVVRQTFVYEDGNTFVSIDVTDSTDSNLTYVSSQTNYFANPLAITNSPCSASSSMEKVDYYVKVVSNDKGKNTDSAFVYAGSANCD